MALTELEYSARWIKTTIRNAGVTEPVARGLHPFKGEFPMVVLVSLAPTDRYLQGLVRYSTRFVWRVTAVDKSWDTENVSDLAYRVDAALTDPDRAYDPIGPHEVNSCYRESPYEDSQIVDGQMYRYQGGVYIVRFDNGT